MTKLISTTILPAPPGEGGESFRVFGPEDELPEWAARQMGTHLFENGEHPYAAKEEPDLDREPGAIPPKSGKGSGRDNWAAYANDVDVDIPADASREDIITAIEQAGKPTEYQN